MADEKQFAKGMFWNAPREGAPSFVMGAISFKVADAVVFLQQHENNAGYVNVDVKVSREGKTYLELNTWKPEAPASIQEAAKVDPPADYPGGPNPDDIPF